jgi:hypothetical protein
MEEAMEVRSALQQIALEHRRRYGYRRVSAELRRRGMLVNHKRVARIMPEDNLLAVQPRQFVVTTVVLALRPSSIPASYTLFVKRSPRSRSIEVRRMFFDERFSQEAVARVAAIEKKSAAIRRMREQTE